MEIQESDGSLVCVCPLCLCLYLVSDWYDILFYFSKFLLDRYGGVLDNPENDYASNLLP